MNSVTYIGGAVGKRVEYAENDKKEKKKNKEGNLLIYYVIYICHVLYE